MKILDKIGDKIIQISFIDEAFAREKCELYIYNLSHNLLQNIVNVSIMPESETIKEWLNEIDNILFDLNTMRIRRQGLLTSEQYWEWILETPDFIEMKNADYDMNHIDSCVKIAEWHYSEKISLPNNLKNQIFHILKNMCIDLGNHQVKNAREYFK